jgi:hypothetical protein
VVDSDPWNTPFSSVPVSDPWTVPVSPFPVEKLPDTDGDVSDTVARMREFAALDARPRAINVMLNEVVAPLPSVNVPWYFVPDSATTDVATGVGATGNSPPQPAMSTAMVSIE